MEHKTTQENLEIHPSTYTIIDPPHAKFSKMKRQKYGGKKYGESVDVQKAQNVPIATVTPRNSKTKAKPKKKIFFFIKGN